MKVDLSEVLELATSAALEAGKLLFEIRKKGEVAIHFKGERDLLTEADLGAEKIILRRIREKFPDHAIISEEDSPKLADSRNYSAPLWVIDPVDGTTNFAQGHHHVGVSIAFCNEGVVQVGVVFAPFLDEMFTAIRGQGAFRNDQPIKVSSKSEFDKCLIGTGFPYDRSNLSKLIARLDRMLVNCRDLRRLGAASLDICWVACARLDGFYETLASWDMAAACLIAREAGAAIGHSYRRDPKDVLPLELDGKELVVSGKEIFTTFLELLA